MLSLGRPLFLLMSPLFALSSSTTQPAVPAQATFLAPEDPTSPLGSAIVSHELAQPLGRLQQALQGFHDRMPPGIVLSRSLQPFLTPFALPELADAVSTPAVGVAGDPAATALRLMRENLDLPTATPTSNPAAESLSPSTQSTTLPRTLLAPLRQAGQLFEKAFPPELPVDPAARAAFAEDLVALLRVPGQTFYISGPEAPRHQETLRKAQTADLLALSHAFEALAALTTLSPAELISAETAPIELPEALAGAVEGTIIAAERIEGVGWVVIGSPLANRYDLSRVAVVIDSGGDDRYDQNGPATGIGVIVDLAGDDLYTGDAAGGPAGAVLGLSLIDDRAGDDRYISDGVVGCGSAAVGVAMLLDRAGNDHYQGKQVSQGAAFVGGGFLFDLGAGSDVYVGQFLCQGVGLTAGVGALVDEAGRDVYRVNGPKASIYATPAVSFAMSQGIGMGFRRHAAGGIGLLCDLAGDDRYEAGEFAQGGAYFYGLGVLRDFSGRDLYYGNRYTQGFGVHQAHGALIDDAGDDTYWGMTAASQGAGWDAGVGLLLDRAGNDSYQADGLAQGGASNQAIGMLIDLAGTDRYIASGGAIQGQAGGNEYHWEATGAGSFALLLDLGGTTDIYSSGRPDSATTLNDPPPPAEGPRQVSGVVIDQ